MEQNRARMLLWNSLVTVPHRDYASALPAFEEALQEDPDFASRAIVEMRFRSKIRDAVDVGVIALLQSDPTFPQFREAGRCLLLGSDVYSIAGEYSDLQGLPPFRILRIDHFIRRSDHKSPRLMKGIATDWLTKLESNHRRFDGVIMQPNGKRGVKAMYKAYHVKANDYARAILWDKTPPENSMPWAVKQVVAADDVTEKARLVMEYHIPYATASSLMPKSVEAGIALVDIMTPTQALNSRSWVEKLGVLEIPEVKSAYLAKLSQAQASVSSAEHRKSAQGADEEVQAVINQAKETAVAHSAKISRDTLLLVDKSGSMESAIQFAQQAASRIAPLCDGNFMVVAFDTHGRVITARDNSLAAWKSAFSVIRAQGGTSVGSGLSTALNGGFMPEQVVIITDEGENNRPYYADVLQQYMGNTGLLVNTYVINLKPSGYRSSNSVTLSLAQIGFPYERFAVADNDYYVLDQLGGLLAGAKGTSLVDLILQRQLPCRVGKSF